MKNKILILFMLLVFIMLSACGGATPEPTEAEVVAPEEAAPEEAAPEEAAPAGPETIKIGTSAPLTGMFAGFGEGCTFGAQAAVDDINAQGGIYVKEYDRKIPVEYIVVDNESDPGKSGSLAEDLILRDKVDLLYSVDSSPSIHIPIAEVREAKQNPGGRTHGFPALE